MSTSDGTGAVGKAVGDDSEIAATSVTRGENGRTGTGANGAADADQPADPWFTPGPKIAIGWTSGVAAEDAAGYDDDGTVQWFLPTGRAGLLPDSMTVSWDEDGSQRAEHQARRDAVGSPPWDGDRASAADGTPPPWETGPWPGPGERVPARAQHPSVARPADVPRTDDSVLRGLLRRRSVRLIVAGGAAALVLIVIIVVILTGTSGGSSGGCGTYPAAVRQAYARAMSDIHGNAPASVQATDLGLAARRANSSAASAGQLSVRTALFAMASDLEQAHADVAAHRAVPADLQQHLADDGAALPGSCPS